MHADSDTKPVVVIGAMNVDLVAKAERFPRPGETITGDSFYRGFGGKGANQAVAAARMGAPVCFIGRVGDDAFGGEMIEHMNAQGVDTGHMKTVEDCASGIGMIFVNGEAQNEIIVVQGANDRLTPADVAEAEETIAGAGLVVVVFDLLLETVREAVLLARKHGVPTIVNPAPPPPKGADVSFLDGVDVLVPNETEAEALTGISVEEPDFAKKASKGLGKIGARTSILTLGEDGSMLSVGDEIQHVPAYDVVPEDTTAAGDAFIGGLAAGYGRFSDLRELVRFASAVAALAVTRKGAMSSLPTRSEVEAFLSKNDPNLLPQFRAMPGGRH
jgi:ribokinase